MCVDGVHRAHACGCHRCRKGQLQEKKEDYPFRLTFEVREGYRGTKRQGVSSEGVSAEKEKDLPLLPAFEARKGIALRLTTLYTCVSRRTRECRTRA